MQGRDVKTALSREGLARWFFAWVAVVVVWSPMLVNPGVDDRLRDWSYRADYTGYAVHALAGDHVFPFWVTDPRFEQLRVKRVHDFFANPETDVLSPMTPLAALSDVVTAAKVSLVLYLALGVWGIARVLVALRGRASLVPLVAASLLAFCNGAFVAHVMVGHVQFEPTAMFPLALAELLEAGDPASPGPARALHACFAACVLSLAYYAGAVHPLTFALPTLFVLVPLFTALVSPWRAKVVLPAAALAVVAFASLSAFKLLPGLRDFTGYRAEYHDAYGSLRSFATELLTPWIPDRLAAHHETNLYVGWIGVVLLALALPAVRDRRVLPLLLACAALTAAMFLNDEKLLAAIPLLRGQGALRRGRLVLMQLLAIATATQVDALLEHVSRSTQRALRAGATAVGAAALVLFAVDLGWTNVARHAVLAGDDTVAAPVGPVDTAPVFTSSDPSATRIVPLNVTADAFAYDVTSTSPGPIELWSRELPASRRVPPLRLVGDGVLGLKNGCLAVRLDKPHARFELRYDDPLVRRALAITVTSLVAVLGLALFVGRAAQRRSSAR